MVILMVVTSDGNGIGECALKLFTSDVVKGHYAYMAYDIKVYSDQEKLSLFTLPSSMVP